MSHLGSGLRPTNARGAASLEWEVFVGWRARASHSADLQQLRRRGTRRMPRAPPVVHLDRTRLTFLPALRTLLDALAFEATSSAPGATMAAARITEALMGRCACCFSPRTELRRDGLQD